MLFSKQLWGNKNAETQQAFVEDNTWCLTKHYQAPFLSTFTFKAGNKDYALSGIIEQSGEQGAKLKTSEIALKKKYS